MIKGISVTVSAVILILIGELLWKTVGGSVTPTIVVKDLPTVSMYKNPTAVKNIGDPFALRASDGKYYVYPTAGFKAWTSDDLYNWKSLGSVYKKTAKSWGVDRFWAPEVVEYNNKYYMYYTAESPTTSTLRIGVAVSDSPKGPFEDPYNHPLLDPGYGCLDPNVLIDDDGRKYLYYSRAMSENVVNSAGRKESHTYVVELGDDMISLKGEPKFLLKPEQSWENSPGAMQFWNEGPAAIKHNGTYYIMYSANAYTNPKYSVGYATSKSPMGPFVKYENNPVLSAESWAGKVSGPGHNSVTKSPDGTELWVVYHTHMDPKSGGGGRQVNIDRMGFREDGTIYMNGPTLTPQLKPSGVTDLKNIAPEAKVTASSTKDGYRTAAITDGEIGIYERNEKYEWASNAEKSGAWVKLEWTGNKKISSIFLYDSAKKDRKLKSGKLVFSNGATLEGINFPEEPGAAAIVSFEPIEIKWVKFVADQLVNDNGEAGISEIMVIE